MISSVNWMQKNYEASVVLSDKEFNLEDAFKSINESISNVTVAISNATDTYNMIPSSELYSSITGLNNCLNELKRAKQGIEDKYPEVPKTKKKKA